MAEAIELNLPLGEGGAESVEKIIKPLLDIEKGIKPRDKVDCEIKFLDGSIKKIKLLSRIDTANEIEYYKNGGILQFVLRNMT